MGDAAFDGEPTTGQEAKRSPAARVVFGVALLASAALLLHYRLKVGFVADDWTFLRDRSLDGFDSFLEPHNENIVVLQAMIYRVFYILFGIESAVPLQVISLVFFLGSVVAFFAWIRERVGEWTAACVSIPLLFLGTAYQDLLWAFQMGYTISILGGLVGLIALERGGRFSQPVACIALLAAVTASSMGIPFLAGVAVFLFLRDGWRGLRSYALIVPVLVFIAWWAGWGRTVENFVSLDNLLDSPVFVAESIKSVVMGLTGLHRLDSPLADLLGWIGSVALVATTVVSLIRRRTLPRPLLVALAVGLGFWVLTAANQVPGTITRDPDQSRYQYPGAVFLLMILAGAFDGYRPGKRWLAGFAALAAVSVACSLGTLSQGQKTLTEISAPPKVALTAMGLAGADVDPEYQVRLVPFFPIFISQVQFRELEDRYGRAGWDEEQIGEQSEKVRRMLDAELVTAFGLELVPESDDGISGCLTIRLKPEAREIARIPAGKLTIEPRDSDAEIKLGRFADEPTAKLGTAISGQPSTVYLPSGLSTRPWQVAVSGNGPARVCLD